MSKRFSVELDEASSMAYVTFSGGPVAKTVAINDDLNIDLDENGNVLGIEYLNLKVELPEERLIDEFKMDAELVHKLNRGMAA
jgi:uncharacterized protein YuzE